MESFGTLKIALRSRKLRFRLRQIALQTVHFRLEGSRINLKQEVALTNNRAFLEMHALQVAGNARANLDGVNWFKASGEFVTVSQLLAYDFRHTHFRRCSSLRLSRTGTPGTYAGKNGHVDNQQAA